MSSFYCPFCSSRYQIHKTNSEGLLVCGQCGDPLIKKPLVNFRQIFSLIAVSAFIFPLLIMIFFVIKDFNDDKLPKNSLSSVLLKIN